MSDHKVTLLLRDYHNGGGDLEIEVAPGYAFQISSTAGGPKTTRLTVYRKPDKYSTRLGMFAFLRTQPGYASLGFPEVVLTVDEFDAKGKFIKRAIYWFSNVRVESALMRGDREEITLVGNGFNEMKIAQVSVTFP